jgi:SdrD B-like domain
VWIDANKNGVQDAGEASLSGVKVELYNCSGLLLATTMTDNNGLYLFSNLNGGTYKVKFTLPNGYSWTQKGTGTATDSDVHPDGSTDCLTLAQGENRIDVDAGLFKDPVSCNSVQFNIIPTNTGARIDYVCNHAGATSASFKLMSGSTTIATANGFTGSVFAMPGTYTGVCTLDGNISYKVVTYVPPSKVICAYKQLKTNVADICAVKNTLSPFSGSLLNLANLILMPSPIPYCTVTQNNNTTDYACVDSPAGSKILTQDLSACTASGIVIKKLGKLGDYVWLDVNKNGIQDSGESGVSGAVVELYSCSSA